MFITCLLLDLSNTMHVNSCYT